MNLGLVLTYFVLPTGIDLIGLIAVKPHERSTPPATELDH